MGCGWNLARVSLSVVRIACLIRAADVRILPEDGSGEDAESVGLCLLEVAPSFIGRDFGLRDACLAFSINEAFLTCRVHFLVDTVNFL